jgi:mannose-1-phosphate guanylyltransferase
VLCTYGAEAAVLVAPADHLIGALPRFSAAVDQALDLAAQNQLVVFGVKPDAPKTEYGYILAEGTTVRAFIEKPDAATAAELLAAGHYLWNAGLCLARVGTLLAEAKQHCPAVFAGAAQAFSEATQREVGGLTAWEVPHSSFAALEDISIDYALLERTAKVAVVPCDFPWTDMGSLVEMGQQYPEDEAGNRINAETVLASVSNSIIYSEGRLVGALGLDNILIVDTPDALLVADKARHQEVKTLVSALKAKDHPAHAYFPLVHRPWGHYEVLYNDTAFKVKKIAVKPQGRLSLQSHVHRSEHWVVVSGKAQVTRGTDVLSLSHNESTYIPAGCVHRLENLHDTETLVVIEVQCGAYLGEDDITRYDDVYGRAAAGQSETMGLPGVAALTRNVDTQAREDQTLRHEIEALQAHLAALLQSRSWRWMAPLRWAGRCARKAKSLCIHLASAALSPLAEWVRSHPYWGERALLFLNRHPRLKAWLKGLLHGAAQADGVLPVKAIKQKEQLTPRAQAVYQALRQQSKGTNKKES